MIFICTKKKKREKAGPQLRVPLIRPVASLYLTLLTDSRRVGKVGCFGSRDDGIQAKQLNALGFDVCGLRLMQAGPRQTDRQTDKRIISTNQTFLGVLLLPVESTCLHRTVYSSITPIGRRCFECAHNSYLPGGGGRTELGPMSGRGWAGLGEDIS